MFSRACSTVSRHGLLRVGGQAVRRFQQPRILLSTWRGIDTSLQNSLQHELRDEEDAARATPEPPFVEPELPPSCREFKVNRCGTNSKLVRLVRFFGEGETVTVTFEARPDPNMEAAGDEGEQEEPSAEGGFFARLRRDVEKAKREVEAQRRAEAIQRGEEYEGDELSTGEDVGVDVQFTVDVSKGGADSLVFDCEFTDGELIIHHVVSCATPEERDALRVSQVQGGPYVGPELDKLDETLHSLLYEYIQARGINEDLAYYIDSYSQYREQELYVRWLEGVHDFVSN